MFCRWFVSEPEHHHVHFDDTILLKDEFETENSVTYQKSGDHAIIVHLGFLQVHHRYHIDLKLPAAWFTSSAEPLLVPASDKETNVHCKLVDFHYSEETVPPRPLQNDIDEATTSTRRPYYNIKVEYFAHDDKLLKEGLKLVNAKNLEEIVKLIITARVLGKGKGTPLLRNGIHCIGSEEERGTTGADSDASDQHWKTNAQLYNVIYPYVNHVWLPAFLDIIYKMIPILFT